MLAICGASGAAAADEFDAGAVPGHIHHVIQPVTRDQVAQNNGLYGPALQMEMFRQNRTPDPDEIERIAERARTLFAV